MKRDEAINRLRQHAGSLSQEDTVNNLTLFAREVLPRLQAYQQPCAESPEAA
jgi:hypothetical protein